MVASGVMIKMVLAPTMTRDSTSRPSGSVPNQCAADGAWLEASNCCASGSYGAKERPKMAQTIQNNKMPAPTRKVGLRSSSRHAAGATRWVGASTAIATVCVPSAPRGSADGEGGPPVSLTPAPRSAAAG